MPYPYSYDEEAKEYKPPKLMTNRSMWKLMLLNILTLGIYSIIFFIPFSFDLDKIAPNPDRSKTPNFLLAYILALFTLSITLEVWLYHITSRIENALSERDIAYDFGTDTFWGWYFFGSFFLIGPFIYFYKLCKAMNMLCEHYNDNPVAAK